MPKKYSLSSIASKNILVIVESPSKCKKIEQYLGSGYKCVATFGHLRELSSLKNIDMEHQFKLTYTIIDKKREQIAMLQKEINLAKEVILFTDADREGEAIAWHCCELFKLSVERIKRITCNEITESGVQSAVNHPRTINMRLVHAQQARQVLDLLVGFQVTPTLWKHFTRSHANSLSAGRCQTPALRIIYENQQEIELVKERKVYNTVGYFTNLNLPFKLNKQWEEESEMTEYLWQTSEFSHVYTYDPPKKVTRSPPIPFSTSKLQQASSNDLRMSPKETMKVCQKLYEAGYITYMRTDSHKYSKEFIISAKNYITNQYDLRYVSETIDTLLTSTSDGEAHEAIRPTNISLLVLPDNMESKERKMYKLIWENTLESCMSAATFHSITARIEAAQRLEFNYTTNLIDFPGWKIVSKKHQSELEPVNKEYHYLQSIKQNASICYIKVVSTVTLANTKSHYSEAMLVQLLESKGIGRPSTFASIVDKLLEREYVTKEDIVGTVVICKDLELENNEVFEIETKREFGNEKHKLKLQPLGRMVVEFLLLHFNELFEYDFTKNMETRLDNLLLETEDPSSWPALCKECNDLLSGLIRDVSSNKMSIKIDDTHSYMVGKYGPVVKCTEKTENGNKSVCFKGINKDTDIEKLLSGQVNLTEVLKESSREKSYILGKHNNLDDIVLKKGKYGLYLTWGKNTKNLKELGNRPIESIRYEDIEKYLEQGSNMVREISNSISIRKGAKGHYIFYKTLKMKQPTFHSLQGFKQDHEKCDVYAIKLWLKDTFNIS
jgi:DNA topoisomerase-1